MTYLNFVSSFVILWSANADSICPNHNVGLFFQNLGRLIVFVIWIAFVSSPLLWTVKSFLSAESSLYDNMVRHYIAFLLPCVFGVSRWGHQIYAGKSGIPSTYISSLLIVEINIFINCLYSPSFYVLASSLFLSYLWRTKGSRLPRVSSCHWPIPFCPATFNKLLGNISNRYTNVEITSTNHRALDKNQWWCLTTCLLATCLLAHKNSP